MLDRAAYESYACTQRSGNATACMRDWSCAYSASSGACLYCERLDRALAVLLTCKYSMFSRHAQACYQVNALDDCVRVHRDCRYFARTYLPHSVPDQFHCALRIASDAREVYTAFEGFQDGTGKMSADWFGECSTNPLLVAYYYYSR